MSPVVENTQQDWDDDLAKVVAFLSSRSDYGVMLMHYMCTHARLGLSLLDLNGELLSHSVSCISCFHICADVWASPCPLSVTTVRVDDQKLVELTNKKCGFLVRCGRVALFQEGV